MVVAPGEGIPTTALGGGYTWWWGTSASCSMAAGLCALIWSRNPDLDPWQLHDVLRNSCDDLGAQGIDNVHGHGRIHAARALTDADGAIGEAFCPAGLNARGLPGALDA